MKRMLLILFLFISSISYSQDVVSTLLHADSATIKRYMSQSLSKYQHIDMDSSNATLEFFLNDEETENGIISYFFYFDKNGCNSIRLIFDDYVKFNHAVSGLSNRFIKLSHASFYDEKNAIVINAFSVRSQNSVLYLLDLVPFQY